MTSFRHRLLTVIAGLCFLLAIVTPIAAQDSAPAVSPPRKNPPGIQQVQVQVMPEFDDPRVLVIVQGRLDVAANDLPLEVTFPVPRGAQINQMATMSVSTGQTTSQNYTALPDPQDIRWSLVTYTLDEAHFFYEYYYDPLEGATDKSFAFTFTGLYDVADLLLEFQEPLAATHFTLQPPPTITRSDESFGFTYHQYRLGAVSAGEELAFRANYVKTSSEPSLTREQVAGWQTAPPSAESPVKADPLNRTDLQSNPDLVPILFVVTAVSIIGVAIWWYRSPRAFKRPKIALGATAVTSNRYCVHCGVDLRANSRFCHVCGMAVMEEREKKRSAGSQHATSSL